MNARRNVGIASPNLDGPPGQSSSRIPRMWDGEGLGSASGTGGDGKGAAGKERDLTNTKLAKNQLVRSPTPLSF